jgi:hypothetical protein
MRIIDIKPKDIHITIELSLSEVTKILNCMGASVIKHTGGDGPSEEDIKFFKEEFFGVMNKLEEDLKRGNRPNSERS